MNPARTVRVCALAFALASAGAGALAPARAARANPLAATAGPGQPVENCADPSVIRSRTAGDDAWYMVCTSDALGDWDRDGGGGYRYRTLPILRSTDLVHWTYVGDAVTGPPSWAEAWSNLWAPEFEFVNGLYSVYYAATDTRRATSGEPNCGSDSAIGVATSAAPGGPYTHHSAPVVAPRRAGAGCSFYATIDPEVTLTGSGQRSIYYGSFSGGIEVRTLSADGLTSDAGSAVRVAADGRFEAPEIVRKDGWYYLLLSASTCCDGPASGYTVVAGRAASPTGPFLDRDGIPLDTARAGGTPVLAATGNRWVGPGHNTVLQDLAGGWWTIYHAIEEADPWFEGSVGYTRRPPLLDPLDWVDGWPTVRGGWWVSDCQQPAPVATAGGVPEYAADAAPRRSARRAAPRSFRRVRRPRARAAVELDPPAGRRLVAAGGRAALGDAGRGTVRGQRHGLGARRAGARRGLDRRDAGVALGPGERLLLRLRPGRSRGVRRRRQLPEAGARLHRVVADDRVGPRVVPRRGRLPALREELGRRAGGLDRTADRAARRIRRRALHRLHQRRRRALDARLDLARRPRRGGADRPGRDEPGRLRRALRLPARRAPGAGRVRRPGVGRPVRRRRGRTRRPLRPRRRRRRGRRRIRLRRARPGGGAARRDRRG